MGPFSADLDKDVNSRSGPVPHSLGDRSISGAETTSARAVGHTSKLATRGSDPWLLSRRRGRYGHVLRIRSPQLYLVTSTAAATQQQSAVISRIRFSVTGGRFSSSQYTLSGIQVKVTPLRVASDSPTATPDPS